MRLKFKATAALPLYLSPTIGPLKDGGEVEVNEAEGVRLVRDFPENFSEAKEQEEKQPEQPPEEKQEAKQNSTPEGDQKRQAAPNTKKK